LSQGRLRRAALAFVVTQFVLAQTQTAGAADLGDLSLEQLSNIVVSTVSGRAEPLSRAMGSVYVITSDDIRRYGATTIMEALRLAPNLQIARQGANGYAITARGFNDTLSNKLLVLIDGRSIYTPTFSGVFWDAQDVYLEDIDRIEVVSGPGGVLWGANAVNGVINILTKLSTDTRGTLADAEAGTNEARLEGRYGVKGGYFRVYAQASQLDDTKMPDGTDNMDGGDRFQAGFRSDWDRGANSFTVQGDAYTAESNLEPQPQDLDGFNVLARWNRDLGEGGVLRVQTYYDHTSRESQRLDTADLELAHALRPYGRHSLLWGGGARWAHDRIENSAAFAFIPADKTLDTWNVYLQDVISLNETVDMTVGARVDANEYTGVEVLPSIRVGWRPMPDSLLWGAVSRAVREPARIDREFYIPGVAPFALAGGPDFESEISYVYEVGYRSQQQARFSWAATIFYHELHDQRSISPGPTAAVVANDREGHTVGIESWGTYRAFDWWRLWFGYTYLDKDLKVKPGAVDLQPASGLGGDPKQWAKVRSAFDLGKSVELDVMIRYYDRLENIDVPSYTAVDFRVGWTVTHHVELSLFVQNLFDDDHIEWAPGAELDRAAVLKALFRF
jgi:iron complex outermembrane receptor protein